MKNLCFIPLMLLAVSAVAQNEIKKPDATTYWVISSPIKGTYIAGVTEPNQVTTTGRPILYASTDMSNAYNSVWSKWSLDKDGNVTNQVVREQTWTVGYTKEDIKAVLENTEKLVKDLQFRPIKHPVRDEYAIAWNQYLIDQSPDGALKVAIEASHTTSASAGRVKTESQMVTDGWKDAKPTISITEVTP